MIVYILVLIKIMKNAGRKRDYWFIFIYLNKYFKRSLSNASLVRGKSKSEFYFGFPVAL